MYISQVHLSLPSLILRGLCHDSVPEGNYRVYFSKSSNDINSPTKSRKIIEVTIEAGKKTVVDPVTF